MNQAERRLYLIRYLLAEDRRLTGMEIPPDKKGQEDLLRALMNIRPPKPVGEEFLAVQDAYLREERDARGITDASTLTPVRDNLCLWQGDITTLAAGGIVNAANSALLGCFIPLHGCIDNIIHSRAGVQLRLACQELMEARGHEEPTGQAKITPAYNLPSRFVLHTVGPVITGRVTGEDDGCSPPATGPAWRSRRKTGLRASPSAASPPESSISRTACRRNRRPDGGGLDAGDGKRDEGDLQRL